VLATVRYTEMMDSAPAPAWPEITRTPFAAVFLWICPSTPGSLRAGRAH